MSKCHICGVETDYECRDCGQPVCDNCTVPYNQFTQIDYTLCKQCVDMQYDARVNDYIRQEQEENARLQERLIKNEKQRKYYHSDKAIEKRILKKIELQKLRAKNREESLKSLRELFTDIFKYL